MVNNMNNEIFTVSISISVCLIHTVNLDLGYSDHLPQLIHKIKKLLNAPKTICKRHFTDKNVKEFQFKKKTFNIFMDTFSHYFNIAFPLKVTHVKRFCCK
jgi:hypothetical protein